MLNPQCIKDMKHEQETRMNKWKNSGKDSEIVNKKTRFTQKWEQRHGPQHTTLNRLTD